MPVTSRETIEALRVMQASDADEVLASNPARSEPGSEEVIGPNGTLPPTREFTLHRLTLDHGSRVKAQCEVLFVHRGRLSVTCADGEVELGEGDTITVPEGLASYLHHRSRHDSLCGASVDLNKRRTPDQPPPSSIAAMRAGRRPCMFR